jgi:hypothetical protein
MLRLTLMLTAALYVGFVVWGEPTDAVSVERASGSGAPSRIVIDYDRPVILSADASRDMLVTRAEPQVVVPDPAAVAASAPAPSLTARAPIGEPIVVSLVGPAAGRPTAEAAETEERASIPESDLLRVTGSVVNMRAGPSTANAVIDSLSRGTLTERLGDPVNGWQEIRDPASGRTGWMFARFLEPS